MEQKYVFWDPLLYSDPQNCFFISHCGTFWDLNRTGDPKDLCLFHSTKRTGYFFLKCILKPKTYYNFYLGSEGDGKVIGGKKATKGKQRTVLWQPYACPFVFLGDEIILVQSKPQFIIINF